MAQAIAAGCAVLGQTGDNPAVGCIIVWSGKVVGTGATQPPGQPHAEIMAIRAAETAALAGFRWKPEAGRLNWQDCDLYVTLEPCTFHGRTPPCVERIVALRPRRVVVALRDPHPRVNGEGLNVLRQAGIEVTEGVLADQAWLGLAQWMKRFTSLDLA